MEFNAKKIDGANATITTTLTKELLEENLNKVAKHAAKDMNIQGFRKGKVPVAIVKQRFGDKLEQDAQSEALRLLLVDALQELNLDNNDIIGEPAITQFDKKDDGSIDVEVKISSKPVVELGEYKALVPEVQDKDVSDEDVDKRLEEMAQSSAPLQKIKRKRMVRDGDYAVIDFEGFVNGEPFEGGKAEKYSLHVGSGSFIPGFEEQVIGMKYDEQKDVVVTFPKEYQAKNLAGQEATFKVTLHEIQEKGEPVIDDAFAAKMLPNEQEVTVDILKEKVKEQLKSETMSKYYNEDLKPQLLEKLVKEIQFDLPESVVEQEISQQLNTKVQSMSQEEIQKLQTDKEAIEKLKQEARPDALESVKATFIVDALAKAEEVEVSDQEVQQVIYYEAMQMGQNPQEALKMYTENGYMPAIKMSMIEDRVLTKLFDEKLAK